mmetsp:Transcript_26964/g.58459  ORF Transcript_26964/g.58459 Transcript_26964/m.58459 type:complete len:622 (-) Transcript_26964:146-2011(-)
MMHHYKDDNDSDSDSQNGSHSYGDDGGYGNNDEHDEQQSASEQTGFLSGGDPTNHNEFRFSGFDSAPVNSPRDGHDATNGGGLNEGRPLGGLGRRLGGLGQRWGLRGPGPGGGLSHSAPPSSSYANQVVSSDRATRTLSQMGNRDVIPREGALLKRITNLNLGERIWGPGSGLDLNQLIMREDWGLAAMQCRMRPHLAGRWLERSGFFMGRHSASVLPLHQAVALHPPVEMIQTLVLTYPAGIKSKETSFGRLPLHVACRSGASPEAIECLLAYHPDGGREGDTLKRIPLHYALKNDAGAEVVEQLLEAYPEGVKRSDHRGWIPLHVACSMGTELSIIEMLLEEYPETVLMKTRKGSDCIKCAEMSRGHVNEGRIVEFMKERMAEAEAEAVELEKKTKGGDEEEKVDGDGRGGGSDDDEDDGDDDESHHEDDEDLIDLDGGGPAAAAAGGDGDGEVDLLGLTSSNSGGTGADADAAQSNDADDLLLDLDITSDDVTGKETSATSILETETGVVTATESKDLGGAVVPPMPPMPAEAPPPPPPPQSTVENAPQEADAPLAFMSGKPLAEVNKDDEEESPTSIVENIAAESAGEGDLLNFDLQGLQDGSEDVVKALEGNMIQL